MTISLYSPRSMAAALKEMKPARTFLKTMFFGGPPRRYTTETIDVDIQTGSRRAAEFTNRKGPGKAVDREGFTTYHFTPPNVALKSEITIDDMQTRLPGEHIYAEQSPEARAAALLGADLAELDAMITRREELMVRDGLVNGVIVADGDDVAQTITFPARHASLTIGTLAAGKRWDAATADILRDLRDWRRAIAAQSGLSADVLILGSTAIDALLASTPIQAILDNRRMDLGLIGDQLMNAGASYVGRLQGIDLWGYEELDASGDPLISAKTALMGSTQARCDLCYGAVGVKSGEGDSARIALVPSDRVPESWVEREPAVRWVKISSRPLPVPVQNNGFLTATVLA